MRQPMDFWSKATEHAFWAGNMRMVLVVMRAAGSGRFEDRPEIREGGAGVDGLEFEYMTQWEIKAPTRENQSRMEAQLRVCKPEGKTSDTLYDDLSSQPKRRTKLGGGGRAAQIFVVAVSRVTLLQFGLAASEVEEFLLAMPTHKRQ